MRVNIYIESSIKGLKRRSGVVGFILEAEGYEGKTVTQFGSVKEATENQAQLLALKYALKRIKDMSELRIWTDNSYMAAAFEQDWISGWIERGWKTAKGKEVANREEWESILQMLGESIPEFQVAQSHSFKSWLSKEIERRVEKYV